MCVNSAEGTGHSQPANREGKWTPTCRTRGWVYLDTYMQDTGTADVVWGVLLYSSSR